MLLTLKPLSTLVFSIKKEHQFLDALLSGRQDCLPAGRQAFGPPLWGGLNKKLTRCARLSFFLVRSCVQARTAPNKKSQHLRASFLFVGKTGFEPATPWSQTRCATGLRYFPIIGFTRIFSTAVRAGFEPAVQFNPYGSLANY